MPYYSDDFVAALVRTAPVPSGYSLSVTVQREFKTRNLWNIRVMLDGERVWGRAYYNVAAGVREAQTWAWDARSVKLTPVQTCGICDRREADSTVVIEDDAMPVCDTCMERADDA